MPFLADLDTGLKVALGIAASVATAVVLLRKLRVKVKAGIACVRHHLTIGGTVLAELRSHQEKTDAKFASLTGKVDSALSSMEAIQTDFRLNGGSTLRDAILRLSAHHKMLFTEEETVPLFEFDAALGNVLVSEGYQRLMAVHEPSQLEGFNWFQFVDTGGGSAYLAAVRTAVEARAAVRATAKFRDVEGQPIGEWEMSAVFVGTPTMVRYVGRLRPVCALAQEVAMRRLQAS